MQELLDKIQNLQTSEIKNRVDIRLNEFSNIKKQHIDSIFKELCFCIMTANCSAAKCMEIHEYIGDGFLNFSDIKLAKKFKELGYRFPNVRSKFIIEARNKISQLEGIIKDPNNGDDLREWIVKNIKGIGYKEASHFLRNIGYNDYAIIDFHIIDLLVHYDLIQKPKTLTKSKYLEIEELLKDIGKTLKLNLAELDLYLWFLETGKILK
ncbi:MAG: N-glycosylase/DNA lyase [Candidatus Hodarchaeota archaeon]